ncbi:hypothetical protein DM860_002884 [Cuscuta australis]|uniref:Uncharacterized protein n=1 Tax=Cuscuta australis TaxID=267555 RepID=A0A328D4K4_9ASTE|nr:hypothetical protein DM860_002884 [Cuscuta australis]
MQDQQGRKLSNLYGFALCMVKDSPWSRMSSTHLRVDHVGSRGQQDYPKNGTATYHIKQCKLQYEN